MPRRVLIGRVLVGLLAGGAIAAITGRVVSRYRRDLDDARARLAGVEHHVLPTELGALEYAESGEGEPVLVIHGIFHGCDGGLLSARDLVAGRRVIAPSRFGYLGSAMPDRATPTLQADVFATLLDALQIDQIDVIGISAGTTSALQLALRHPERVRHLVIVSGNWPGSPTAVTQPPIARALYADAPLWVLKVIAPTLFGRMMGVPNDFPLSADDRSLLAEFSDSVFPVGPRAEGAWFDAYVSNPDVNRYPLEAVSVPTLVVHARDDPLASYDAAEQAAARIPDAILVTVESGGHLLLGDSERVGGELAAFLARR